MFMWGSHKDLAISAKPGSGVHFGVTGLPSCVFTHWVKILGAPLLMLETFATEGMVSFEWPMPVMGPMPLALVPQFLPLLCSRVGFHGLGRGDS